METNLKGYWLGHSAFKFISQNGSIVYVDPFLKDNPSTPDEHKEVKNADYILLTHGHEDHVGDTLEIAEKTGCKVVGIVELIGLLKKKGLNEDQAVEFNKGGTVSFEDFSVTMVSANHSSSYGGEYAGDPAGLILSFEDDLCIYHMGDTNIFSDLVLYGELYEPHIVLAPIGDHYTMGPQEAAYAVEMVNPNIAVPIHYGTWPPIDSDPNEFKEVLEDISETEVLIPVIGKEFLQ
ncbi:MAG TPA: metal-dependent hydrolase [Balneola sp.]|jgi:L-ascorbate metabolism protein UlaG (beta-lactamase superfamily)|nr:metal-dependent hydrolase [Balneola sp.]MAO78805.1 metal-dependent hydrolase [Balneola sp.]MBF64679.1 metal-dependent hydrolase [Balneola sp.]HAW80890.1 metal-dependent hydrolase [Balneola sp.]HBZ39078.1 metal-dependent hydrolase [Balneola sp.]|tara:strand:+ start:1579 stop:2283 length:705 start_codon:yes stop_codon:yes gene_type:complete